MYREETNKVKSISEIPDLFGKQHAVTKEGKVLSERATLTKYFCEHAMDRKGPIVPARMGYMLSHLKLPDLYYMKSVLESDSKRQWVMRDNKPQPSELQKWNMLFWSMLKRK